jgi:patatin-like phospholipase/acyl hydrolase
MTETRTPARSSFAAAAKRERLPWPAGKPFRILSIDGGGIKGIYPASVLAEVEKQILGGQPVWPYFDLITGTSTGGILALGLANGLSAAKLRDLYCREGKDVFAVGRWRRLLKSIRSWAMYMYSRQALEKLTTTAFQGARMQDAKVRLCIPSFEGHNSEVAILRTPHHPTCTKLDAGKTMVEVALSTSAAPLYFRPLDAGGYRYVDGGVWANNPTMIGLIEALTCFDIQPEQVRILSLGCGREPYKVRWTQARIGSVFAWRYIIFAAMHLQSENARNQARLLVGPDNFIRLEPTLADRIKLDDWTRARRELPPLATIDLRDHLDRIRDLFFGEPAETPRFFQ